MDFAALEYGAPAQQHYQPAQTQHQPQQYFQPLQVPAHYQYQQQQQAAAMAANHLNWGGASAHAAAAQQPARSVRWGQNEVRYMTPQPEDEAPRDAHSLFNLACGGAAPSIGAFAPGGGFGGFGGGHATTAFAPVADAREACAPISASRLVQRRWKTTTLSASRR